MGEYSCGEIQVLKGLEGIRRRPGMYIGNTGSAGLHHLLEELTDNVVDLHRAAYASELRVELGPDVWVTVRDDGPGLPSDVLPDGVTVLEAMFTRMHGGRRFGDRPLGRSLFSAGLPVVCALSEEMFVETTDRGVRWTQTFARGERTQPPRRIGPTSVEGTTIRFRPDPAIFPTSVLDAHVAHARLQQLAWLNPHLRVWFQEQRVVARGGIAGWARLLADEDREVRGAAASVIAQQIVAHQTSDVRVDVALAWRRDGAPIIRSFVNMRSTSDGTHVAGLWRGFRDHAEAIGSPARSHSHVREAVGCGLVAIVHVQLDDPRYAGCTRERLTSESAYDAVRIAVATSLRGWRAWAARKHVNGRLGVDDANRGS